MSFSKRSIISLFQMTDLTVFLSEKFDVEVNIIIEKLRRCSFEKRYHAQIIILDRIVQTNIILDEKAETFWQYVLNDSDSWRFHHSIVLNFVAIDSIISKIVNAVKKRRSAYQKTVRIIERLWEKKKYDYAVNQLIEILRNMRKVVIKSWFIHDVMKIMSKAIEYRLKISDRDVRKKATSTNDDWAKEAEEMFMSSRLLIETKIVVIMSSSSITRLEEKKNRKTIFVVFFSSKILTLKERKENRRTIFVVLSLSVVLSSIEKKKNQRAIFVDFFFDRISSSFSLTSSSIVFESSLASSSIPSWSSSTLKNMIIILKTLLENEDDFIIHFDESLLAELIHSVSSSFVLSSDSLFFVFIVFASSFSESRFRKKAHESFSSALKKRSRLTNDHCDCTLSSKWLEDLKNARCVESARRTEHLLSGLYYLNRQICKKHINQLRQLFELLSIENFVEMKEVLWELLEFDERVDIFKIERSDLFEVFEDDD